MNDEYSAHELEFGLLAGIFTEQERVRAEEGEEAFLDKVLYQDVMMVGELCMGLEKAGFTEDQIHAEVNRLQSLGQGITSITFK